MRTIVSRRKSEIDSAMNSLLFRSHTGNGLSARQKHRPQGSEVQQRVLWHQQSGHHWLWPVWDGWSGTGRQVGGTSFYPNDLCLFLATVTVFTQAVFVCVLVGERTCCGYLVAGLTTWLQRLFKTWVQRWKRTNCLSPKPLMFMHLGIDWLINLIID